MTEYKVVPVTPTPEMVEAGQEAMSGGCYPEGIYADMIASAPQVDSAVAGQAEKLVALTAWADEIISIVKNRQFGSSHIELVVWLAKHCRSAPVKSAADAGLIPSDESKA